MAGMIPDHHLTVPDAAEYLGVSERRVRDLIVSGDIAGVRVGQRRWAVDAASVVSWGTAHPRGGRRLTQQSQWALICMLANGTIDWIPPLTAHRTRKRIDEWTPEQIADAVAPAIRAGWPPWIGPQTPKPHIRAFEQALSPDPGLRKLGLQHIEDDRTFYFQELRWRWWHDHGVEYDDFWAAPEVPIDRLKSGTMGT